MKMLLSLFLLILAVGCIAGEDHPTTIDPSCTDGLCKYDEIGSMQLSLNATCSVAQASTSSPVWGCCYGKDSCQVGSVTWHCNGWFGPSVCTYGDTMIALNS